LGLCFLELPPLSFKPMSEEACGTVDAQPASPAPCADSTSTVAVVCTWNLGNKANDTARLPSADRFAWLRNLVEGAAADLLVFGLQELNAELLPDFQAAVAGALEPVGKFAVICAEAKGSYYPLLVFEREEEGTSGNGETAIEYDTLVFTKDQHEVASKGCIAARFSRRGVNFCFVNAHLEAGHGKPARRNEMQRAIEEHFKCAALPPHEVLVEFGDLNYRIEASGGCDSVVEPTNKKPCAEEDFLAEFESAVSTCEAGNAVPELLPRCQLRLAQQADQALVDFEEAPLTFSPTYRRVPQSPDEPTEEGASLLMYDRVQRRMPGWCDRVLWMRGTGIAVHACKYDAVDSAVHSDHRPVHVVMRISLDS